jgi:hypothetical protein
MKDKTKKSKGRKKLSLSRESLRTLNSASLEQVVGGLVTKRTCNPKACGG